MNEMPNNIVPVEEPKPESNVVKSNPNLKQHSKLVDSSEHSQFEMIKKQNDYLLICKLIKLKLNLSALKCYVLNSRRCWMLDCWRSGYCSSRYLLVHVR